MTLGRPRILENFQPSEKWRRWLLVAAWPILAFYFVVPVTRVMDASLDSSIRGSYAYFTAHGFQFGPQVNSTAGPYGFVPYGWDYSGNLFWPRYALMLATAGAFAALVLWFFSFTRSFFRWIWLPGAVLGLSGTDTILAAAILLSGFFLFTRFSERRGGPASAAVTALLALLALMKGTQVMLAGSAVAVLVGLAAWRREFGRAVYWALGFGCALVGWWLAAGQNPLHLPSYLDGIRQIAAGYNQAMALDESPGEFVVGLCLALVLGTSVIWTAWRCRRQPVNISQVLLTAGLGAGVWKHGFVRADAHLFIFFDFAVFLVLTLSVISAARTDGQPILRHVVPGLLCAAAIACWLSNPHPLQRGRLGYLAGNLLPQLQENTAYALVPAAIKTGRDSDLAAQSRDADLPATRHFVGHRSIDFFGHEIGLLMLNGLNYHPAPMSCATYHVYNRHFKQRNRRHFADPATRPDFVLLKTQSIDDRFIAQDDSLSLLALFDLYRPVLREKDVLLLATRPEASGLQFPHALAQSTFSFGDDVPVPSVGADELLLFSIDLPSSRLGQLRALAYKPPLVYLATKEPGSAEAKEYRIIPNSIEVPTLLSPVLRRTEDFLDVFRSVPLSGPQTLRLRTEHPECFETKLTVHFYTVRRPAPLGKAELHQAYDHRVFDPPPEYIEPSSLPLLTLDDRLVQLLQSPAQVTYKLSGDERVFSGTIGMASRSYTEGKTDGVDIAVQLERPGQPIELLASRSLRPASTIEDRKLQNLRVPLPPGLPAGTTLTLRVSPGPSGDTGWDWLVGTAFRFIRGDYRPEQFPRFHPLPSSVEGDPISLLEIESRKLVAPGVPSAFVFALPISARNVRWTYGMVEGSYQQGRTDGVEYILEIKHSDGTVASLYRRWLRPATAPEDRGEQHASVQLPRIKAGDQLRVRTTPGPNGDRAWDWTYLSSFEID